jgi:small subunit ribosomal protein S6
VREYEFVYVLHPDLSPEREKEIQARFEDLVARNGGTVLLVDDWGKRKLAFEIRKLQKGHYFLLSFLGSGKFVGDLERVARLDPDVIRFLSVCTDRDVSDIEGRIARAAEEREEHARRRAERERLEAERAARVGGDGDDEDEDDDRDRDRDRDRGRDRDRDRDRDDDEDDD